MDIGIISDTHGLLRPEAVAALRGVEHILHIGDVDAPEILERLRGVAPVTAVRGNVDHGDWAKALPLWDMVELGGVRFYLIHILDDLALDPKAAGIDVVCFGHSHKPESYERGGVHYLNPGSAGPRRFSLPVSLARAQVENGSFEIDLITLDV